MEKCIAYEIREGYAIENIFEHAGLQCVIIFTQEGYRCGYVRVSEAYPLYGKNLWDYLDIEKSSNPDRTISGVFQAMSALLDTDDRFTVNQWFRCHGGLTYSGKDPSYPINSDLWYFGSDCNHYKDGHDFVLAEELFNNNYSYSEAAQPDNIRSADYVIEECKKLADQLADFL